MRVKWAEFQIKNKLTLIWVSFLLQNTGFHSGLSSPSPGEFLKTIFKSPFFFKRLSLFEFVLLWAKARRTSTVHRVKLSCSLSWLAPPPRHDVRCLSPGSPLCSQTLGWSLCHQNDDNSRRKLFYTQIKIWWDSIWN